MKRQCGINGCTRDFHASVGGFGPLCTMHYKRHWRTGTPDGVRNRRPHDVPIHDWFMTLVEKTDSCWLWRGNILHKRGGYGTIYDPRCKKKIRAHHFLVGKPPTGMEWDHLCETVHCVRPDHLELVTVRENRLRQWVRKRFMRRRSAQSD